MDPRQHVEVKIGVLRHLREMFYERALTNEILPIELVTIANDLKISVSRAQGVLAELVALKFATHNAGAPPHTAISDGRAEITEAGLAYLHQVESEKATAMANAELAAENLKLQAALTAEIGQKARSASLEIPDSRSSLKRAGFGPVREPE